MRNAQVSPTAINAGSTEVNSLLQPLPSIAFDLNKLPTQVLMQLQQGVFQELDDKQKDLSEGYVQSQDVGEKLQEEADVLQ